MDIYTLGNDIETNRSRIYDSLRKFLFNFRGVARFRHVKRNLDLSHAIAPLILASQQRRG